MLRASRFVLPVPPDDPRMRYGRFQFFKSLASYFHFLHTRNTYEYGNGSCAMVIFILVRFTKFVHFFRFVLVIFLLFLMDFHEI